jgi:peroxiredoxin
VAKAYGVWLDEPGIGDRATVLIGKDGNVLWAEAVGPGGQRNPQDLLAKATELGQ